MTHELRVERVIDAEPEAVFDAFTEPGGQVAFYQGPVPGWIVRSTCDLRVGGVWSVEFGPAADQLYRHRQDATYEEMAGYWPSSTADYAAPMNELPKVVFSKTLEDEDAGWPESRVARGDLAAEVDRLRRESGKAVVAYGGAAFAQSLARLDLIDEYRLVTHPVAIGEGARLFKDLPAPIRLRHVETRPFKSATVHVYERT